MKLRLCNPQVSAGISSPASIQLFKTNLKKVLFDVTFFRVIRYLYETMMKPEEFNRIIIPMRDELKGLARKLTGDDYSAEDLVQEVMLKLWSMRATLDRYENKRALAMTMLRNKYSDQWRQTGWKTERPQQQA